LSSLGKHLLLELCDSDRALLDDIQYIEQIMVLAAREAGANILGKSFHKFSPKGVTGVVTITESHLCIHTWPEHEYAAVDIFTCGKGFKPYRAAEIIIERLGCKYPQISEIDRGPISKFARSVQ